MGARDESGNTRRGDGNPRRRGELTRREFLNGVLVGTAGLSLGGWRSAGAREAANHPGGLDLRDDPTACHAVAFHGAWAPPPAEGPVLDAVVVGGGLAGLVAAWRLQEAGCTQLLLLEKNGAAGGQAQALEAGGELVASMGSAYASLPYNDDLAAVYDAIGVLEGWTESGDPIVDPRYLLKPPFIRHFIAGAWHDDPWASEAALGRLPLPEEVLRALRELRDDVAAWYDFIGDDGLPAFAWPPDRSSRDPRARALDTQTLATYVQSRGWPAEAAAFFDPLLRSSFGIGSDRISAWVALDFLTTEILPGDPQESVVCQPGGNAFIARRLERLLQPGILRTGAFVFRVANAASHVDVSYLDQGQAHTVRCNTAVVACPRLLVPHIVPEVRGRDGQQDEGFHYSTYLVANVHVDETPPGLAYANEVHGDFAFTDFVLADWAGLDDPTAAPLSRPNILTVYAVQEDRRFVANGSFEEIEAAILSDLETVLPGVGRTVTAFDLFRWGHPMVLNEPNFLFSEARTTAQRSLGRIVFAGHETVGIPYIDSAITSGFRAAREAARLAFPSARTPRHRVAPARRG